MDRELAIWLTWAIPVIGLALAAAGVLYTASGERRDLALSARERSLHFCAELADTCDAMITYQSHADKTPLPPVRASVLLYLRNGLQADLMHQYLAGHMFEGQSLPLNGKAISIVGQISNLCVGLHRSWEAATGVVVSFSPDLAKEGTADNDFNDDAVWYARHIRERVTLLYQIIAQYQLATRGRSAIYILLSLLPDRLSYPVVSHLAKSRKEQSLSVEEILG